MYTLPKKYAFLAFLGLLLMVVGAALPFTLEVELHKQYMANTPDAPNGAGFAALGIVIIAVYALVPLAIAALLQLISFIGLCAGKKKGFLIVGIVGKAFAIFTMIALIVCFLDVDYDGTISKIVYAAMALVFILLCVADKKGINEFNDIAARARWAQAHTPYAPPYYPPMPPQNYYWNNRRR